MAKVVHLIDASTPRDLLAQLGLVAGERDEIISVGPPPAWQPPRRQTAVHCPLGLPTLAGGRLPKSVTSADVIHAWSLPALTAAVCGEIRCRPVLSLPCAPAGEELADRARRARCGEAVLTVPTNAARQQLLSAGAGGDCVRVVSPAARAAADPGEKADDLRLRIRGELGVGEAMVLIAAPGELTRQAGQKYAPWVYAILRQVRDDMRLVVTGAGSAEGRVEFYIGTTGLGGDIYRAADRFAEEDVLAASDVAVFFHERDFGVQSLAAAMSAGLPVAASRTPDVEDLTGGGEAALLVAPASPREGSAALLRLIEDRDLAAKLSAAARRRSAAFAPETVRGQLEEVYAMVRPAAGAAASQ